MLEIFPSAARARRRWRRGSRERSPRKGRETGDRAAGLRRRRNDRAPATERRRSGDRGGGPGSRNSGSDRAGCRCRRSRRRVSASQRLARRGRCPRGRRCVVRCAEASSGRPVARAASIGASRQPRDHHAQDGGQSRRSKTYDAPSRTRHRVSRSQSRISRPVISGARPPVKRCRCTYCRAPISRPSPRSPIPNLSSDSSPSLAPWCGRTVSPIITHLRARKRGVSRLKRAARILSFALSKMQ